MLGRICRWSGLVLDFSAALVLASSVGGAEGLQVAEGVSVTNRIGGVPAAVFYHERFSWGCWLLFAGFALQLAGEVLATWHERRGKI